MVDLNLNSGKILLKKQRLSDTIMDKLQSQVWALYLLIGTAIVVTFNGVSYLVPNTSYQPDLGLKDFDFIKTSRYSPTEDIRSTPAKGGNKIILNNKSNRQFQRVLFSPGNTKSTILKVLGEPVWKKPGFWENSMAWSYEDVFLPGVDIGYIFDRQTGELRQSEIAFPAETDFKTMQLFLTFLGNKPVGSNLQKQARAVHQRQSDFYDFRIDNFKGVVRRNQADRLYIAVWEEDFH